MRKSKRSISIFLAIAIVFSFVVTLPVSAEEADELYQAGLNYDQYPSIADFYKDYFLVGTTGSTSGTRAGFVGYHYNAYTPENAMKPSQTQNTKGTFTFSSANSVLNGALALREDMKLIGHTLAWHSQSPSWMWDSPNYDRETAIENLNTHITRVMTEFGGRLQAIDVVNEAIGSALPGSPNDWKYSVNEGKNEGWCLALGWEFIELAFLKAAEIVDANEWDCKLYYNDFGLNSAAKARLTYEMVNDINTRYAGVRPNGKPLIEGIGMQGHYNKSVKASDVEDSVKLFATLPGVSVSFTEVDVEWLNMGSLTEEQAIEQGQKYAELFQIFKKYAAGPANTTGNPRVIERVTFWGPDDGSSWKGSGFPLLFNAPSEGNITGKEALVAALNPDLYLETYPIEDDEGGDGNKHIDGIYVYSTDAGDAWSGANIILGKDSGVWPWSVAGADGKTAFKPEKDATYRISVTYTSMGTTGIRVRWIKDESNGNYTTQDAAVVGSSPHSNSLRPTNTATMIPCYFNSGMSSGNTYTLVTEIKLDSAQAAEGLIGNIAIRGGGGGNNFVIDAIKVEKIITDGDDKLLVDWPNEVPKPGTEGVHYFSLEKGDAWAGANIILGKSADVWPWSTAAEDGKVAFTPEKDQTYLISVNYTSMGTSAIRVRWVKDNSNGNYTTRDAAVVGSSPHSNSLNPNSTATVIPCYFNSGMVNAGTYTLNTRITLNGSLEAEDLIGNIAIRGGAGGNSFAINWIKVEKVGTGGAPNTPLVNWPDGIVEEEEEEEPVFYTITASADENGSISPADDVIVQEGSNQKFTITPNSGYKTLDVLVDGESYGPIGEYTFTNVNDDHTISAKFIKENSTGFVDGELTVGLATTANWEGDVYIDGVAIDGKMVNGVMVLDLSELGDVSGKIATFSGVKFPEYEGLVFKFSIGLN